MNVTSGYCGASRSIASGRADDVVEQRQARSARAASHSSRVDAAVDAVGLDPAQAVPHAPLSSTSAWMRPRSRAGATKAKPISRSGSRATMRAVLALAFR